MRRSINKKTNKQKRETSSCGRHTPILECPTIHTARPQFRLLRISLFQSDSDTWFFRVIGVCVLQFIPLLLVVFSAHLKAVQLCKPKNGPSNRDHPLLKWKYNYWRPFVVVVVVVPDRRPSVERHFSLPVSCVRSLCYCGTQSFTSLWDDLCRTSLPQRRRATVYHTSPENTTLATTPRNHGILGLWLPQGPRPKDSGLGRKEKDLSTVCGLRDIYRRHPVDLVGRWTMNEGPTSNIDPTIL